MTTDLQIMNKANVKDIIQWDVRTWSRALNYWEEHVDWANVESALELGGRQGGLSLWLARKGIKTLCSDYSESAETAAPLHQQHEYSGQISYEDIDAMQLPYENEFDLIVFKSILGGIAQGDNINRQRQVLEQIHKALKPGGVLLFAENMSSSPLHKALRARHNAWGNYWRYLDIDDFDDLLSPFSEQKIKTTGFLATLGRTESQKNFLSRIDQFCLNSLVPSRWHYLGYGIARK